MMEARPGVTTCDRCGELMKEAQPFLVIVEGNVTESGDEMNFHGSCVQCACHLRCRDSGDGIRIISGLEGT